MRMGDCTSERHERGFQLTGARLRGGRPLAGGSVARSLLRVEAGGCDFVSRIARKPAARASAGTNSERRTNSGNSGNHDDRDDCERTSTYVARAPTVRSSYGREQAQRRVSGRRRDRVATYHDGERGVGRQEVGEEIVNRAVEVRFYARTTRRWVSGL